MIPPARDCEAPLPNVPDVAVATEVGPKLFGVEVRLFVNFCFSALKNVRTHGVQAMHNIVILAF